MLLNKERRIRYIGFNDLWFATIGIVVLSFVTDFIFGNSFGRYPFNEAVVKWSISLFFSATHWLTLRVVFIWLRKRFPSISEVGKRVAFIFTSIVISVITIDTLGNKILAAIYSFDFNPMTRFRVTIPIIIISTMMMAIYEAIYFFMQLKQSIREEEQAKQAIVQAQLDALRNQAQPHFFFNSLNTLRDIIDQNPKEEAKEFVNKLADVYRHILESGNTNLVSLEDELKFSRAYIHIQSERFGENLKVSWHIPDETLNDFIIPMSLQLLLENAIKHNVVSKSKPLKIEVKVEGERLIVQNNLQLKSTQLPSTKLGLKSIEKRYKLISDQPVEITQSTDRFIVSLPLLEIFDQKIEHASIDR